MYKILLIDLDDTVLDFKKAEKNAIGKIIRQFGVEPTEAVLHRYHLINKAHWERLERGEITREQVLVGRFQVLFAELGREADPTACARAYEKNLSQGHWFLPGAEEALERLQKSYRLFLASNGTASVQHGRMKSANLYRFFEGIFISQEIGYNKPSRDYFEACFARIPDFDREKTLMVGDSLTSDMLGGVNAGINTVWVNPDHKAPGAVRPTYEIENLGQLEKLLAEL
ncbi:MAG: YjjG family noncanonical pyrimidine nucleotidase [Eubacteriales bacterium]|nr:YjjG family noncanonical pyrimidine nucleotidase [Eubacteriales bacterium]